MAGQARFAAIGAVLVVGVLSAAAHAESQFATGEREELAQSARLDFTIVIPAYVYLGQTPGLSAYANTLHQRIIGNGGTLALDTTSADLQSGSEPALHLDSGVITAIDTTLASDAGVNSRNVTVIYTVSLP